MKEFTAPPEVDDDDDRRFQDFGVSPQRAIQYPFFYRPD